MIQKELNKILRLHQMWLNGGKEGERANLEGAYLYKANLEGENLIGANLKEAKLYNANLEGANLTWTNFKGADLEGANLDGANFNEVVLWRELLFYFRELHFCLPEEYFYLLKLTQYKIKAPLFVIPKLFPF